MRATAVSFIVTRISLKAWQVENTLSLLHGGNTVPFIARYRKERTGELDELAIEQIRDLDEQWRALEKRRETILATLEEQGVLSEGLKNQVEDAMELSALEDIYLPYKPKRRTRASIAKEQGLEPLAKEILHNQQMNPGEAARAFIDEEKNLPDKEAALSGARDIIAEWVSENSDVRRQLRALFTRKANIESVVVKGKEDAAGKYKDYFGFTIKAAKAKAHSVHALLRGQHEGFLKVKIRPDDDEAVAVLERRFVRNGPGALQVSVAVADSWKRLLAPSLENEFRNALKEKADHAAVDIFARNLRQLLMQPALGRKRVLAIDPGFASGCKIVCLDEMGNLLHNETIYPHPPRKETEAASRKIKSLVQMFHVEVIGIGNGTASRETEHFISRIRFPVDVIALMVDESGASVYSASKLAREEFPDYDVTVRGAVSIGRRLMDPLAELVKIDPKSIGVGQYQHDVDQAMLDSALGNTVVSCVNKVGVDVNTASPQLLSYVAGLGPALATGIVKYRKENGQFRKRAELMNVPRLGSRAFEQAAGFLRIFGGDHPLDASAVHPESYDLVRQMAIDLDCDVKELIANDDMVALIDTAAYADDIRGLPTIRDILTELRKPGRDPRARFETFTFDSSVQRIGDIRAGMVLPGIVTNVTAFGAFVDIGIKENGLVHISQMADQFIRDPAEVVHLHQKLMVRVLEVDIERKRIQLSLMDTE